MTAGFIREPTTYSDPYSVIDLNEKKKKNETGQIWNQQIRPLKKTISPFGPEKLDQWISSAVCDLRTQINILGMNCAKYTQIHTKVYCIYLLVRISACN